MNKLILTIALILISTCADAAYYFDLGEHGKLTVSKDITSAVIVKNGNEPSRLKLAQTLQEEIDNGGRPYNLSLYYDESCQLLKECRKPILAIKTYNDKESGFYIWMTDFETDKILWQKALSSSALTMDQ
ncbi:hypothetical protein [Pantoea ananatis]|uniref:hypothetical protein n=1 Tax=Pantoea ananas TaxID=553 RepID=UPI00188F7399|nr:hypothetical protein [Pantoea ananatis]